MNPAGSHEPIEDYLDDLLGCLNLPPRETRRLLAETEAHLRESAEALIRAGIAPVEAEVEAIRRFGSAREVAAAAGAARRPSVVALLAQGLWGVLTLAGLGLIAVGVSGGLAALFNAVSGPGFVGALPQTYPAPTCAYYLSIQPGATSCAQAAMWENSHDAVALRLLAGLAGAALIAAAWAWRHFARGDLSSIALRDGAVGAAAAIAFAVAAALLVGLSADLAIQHGSGGVGFYLTGGLASALGAVTCALWAHRRLRHLRPWRLGGTPATA